MFRLLGWLGLLGLLGSGCRSLPDSRGSLQALVAGARHDPHLDPSSTEQAEIASGGGNLDLRSFGARGALHSSVVDLVGGVDRHGYGDESATEASYGLRKRWGSPDGQAFYAEACLRHGFDLDTRRGTRDYDGMLLGIGLLLPIDGFLFVDVGLGGEWTFDRLDLGDGPERRNELVFRLGLGLLL